MAELRHSRYTIGRNLDLSISRLSSPVFSRQDLLTACAPAAPSLHPPRLETSVKVVAGPATGSHWDLDPNSVPITVDGGTQYHLAVWNGSGKGIVPQRKSPEGGR